jgi:hypothetical protein
MAAVPVGSRVTLRGLVARPELNGRAGTVTAHAAPPRLLVALDDDGHGGVAPLAVKPDNLVRDAAQAGAQAGKLSLPEGPALSNLLDMIVVVVSNVDEEQPLDIDDVYPLRNNPAGLHRLALLTAKAYSYWQRAPSGPSVLAGTRAYVKQCIVAFREKEPGAELPAELRLSRDLLAPGGEAARWGDAGGRVHGRFWVMGERTDGAGTTCVSESPDGVCCVALGMAASIAGTLTRPGGRLPALLQLTLLPFCGRLVTDGLMLPPGGTMPRQPSAAERAELEARLSKAEREGTLLFYLPPPPGSAADDASHDAVACGASATCQVCARLRGAGIICGHIGCGARHATGASVGLKQCGACRSAAYCSVEHQRAAWADHKAACRAAVAASAAAAASAPAASASSSASARAPQPLSAAERTRAKRIEKVPRENPHADTSWVVRRLGYDERKNPCARPNCMRKS